MLHIWVLFFYAKKVPEKNRSEIPFGLIFCWCRIPSPDYRKKLQQVHPQTRRKRKIPTGMGGKRRSGFRGKSDSTSAVTHILINTFSREDETGFQRRSPGCLGSGRSDTVRSRCS
ncbi:hypothetical protein NPIL_246141 [Nephila pilipes]|uniref:Uncharacterized protein n=1 Tax=Nephila pilipes TaxID=299642 RepID=A0A8X6MDM5_NEPPI|nr:hypothetical protein NPIL_246141 [Nephila pilipes]